AEGPAVDLGVAWNQPSPTLPGIAIPYRLTVSNAGPSAAEGVHVSVTLPAQPGAIAPGCTSRTGGLDCTIPSIDAGDSATLAFDVVPPSGTRMATASATVSSEALDANAENDSASVTVTVVIASDRPPPTYGEGGCCDDSAASVAGKLSGGLLN